VVIFRSNGSASYRCGSPEKEFGGEPSNHREAIAVWRRAVELGITLIDMADSYGPRVAERLIAEALHQTEVDKLFDQFFTH
jgi:aryl-alcohol dehydrogenase-like predicted oxidoreductase